MENSFGEYLRKERELRDISLEEISQKTRIQKRFLLAIEQDRLNLLPGMVFTKGFIRAYAEYLGLDVNQVLLRFEEFLKNSQSEKRKEKTQAKKFLKSPILWALILGILIIMVVGIYGIARGLKEGFNKVEPLKSGSGTSSEGELAKEALIPKPENVLTPPFVIKFQANELCWIFATIDEKTNKEVMLKPGEFWEIKVDKKLSVIIGNAGGVELTVNSVKLKKIGSHWKPCRLFIPEDLPKYLPEAEPKPQPEPSKK